MMIARTDTISTQKRSSVEPRSECGTLDDRCQGCWKTTDSVRPARGLVLAYRACLAGQACNLAVFLRWSVYGCQCRKVHHHTRPVCPITTVNAYKRSICQFHAHKSYTRQEFASSTSSCLRPCHAHATPMPRETGFNKDEQGPSSNNAIRATKALAGLRP